MNKNAGFTLIELLVVVLIIGILSAVALPQYTKAVEKSRAAEALVMLKAIAQANEVYYLANGEYTQDINNLDIVVPGEDAIHQGTARKKSKFFQYGAGNWQPTANGVIGVANRLPVDSSYWLVIYPKSHRVQCHPVDTTGTELCKNLSNGNKSGAEYIVE